MAITMHIIYHKCGKKESGIHAEAQRPPRTQRKRGVPVDSRQAAKYAKNAKKGLPH
jgi:hypothetical protein